MTTRRTATALAVAAAAIGAGLAAASPAVAGGVIVVASPSHDNSCFNTDAAQSRDATRNGSGTAAGLLAALPIETPLNHCGGADLPGSHGPSNVEDVNQNNAAGVDNTDAQG
ncbi:hypothetical protein [Streptomyces xanthochromogenes]|uniref:hypothetical protein n=1 Tax=Streptomyces xanthochromogenes TaxID=67384 RepID=UPI0016747345|nr:hypothetical protein [Streptomyces xanthochromogenes]